MLDGNPGLDPFLFTPVPEDTPLAMHIHPHLSILFDRQAQVIPAGIGLTPAGDLPIHTHDASGTIHIESPVARNFHLQDFFDVWGQTFSDHEILGKREDDTHQLTMTVNGQVSQAFGALLLHDLDDIVIHYDGPKLDGNRHDTTYDTSVLGWAPPKDLVGFTESSEANPTEIDFVGIGEGGQHNCIAASQSVESPNKLAAIGLGLNDSRPWVQVDVPDPDHTVVEGQVTYQLVPEGDSPFSHNAQDRNFFVYPDAKYEHLLAYPGNFFQGEEHEHGVMEIEWEQTSIPEWAWPVQGDRVYMEGSYIFDCGHWRQGFRTEIHPPRLLMTFRDAADFNSANVPDDAFKTNYPGAPHTGWAYTFPGSSTFQQATRADLFASDDGGKARLEEGVTGFARPDWYQPLAEKNYHLFIPAPPNPGDGGNLLLDVQEADLPDLVSRVPRNRIKFTPVRSPATPAGPGDLLGYDVDILFQRSDPNLSKALQDYMDQNNLGDFQEPSDTISLPGSPPSQIPVRYAVGMQIYVGWEHPAPLNVRRVKVTLEGYHILETVDHFCPVDISVKANCDEWSISAGIGDHTGFALNSENLEHTPLGVPYNKWLTEGDQGLGIPFEVTLLPGQPLRVFSRAAELNDLGGVNGGIEHLTELITLDGELDNRSIGVVEHFFTAGDHYGIFGGPNRDGHYDEIYQGETSAGHDAVLEEGRRAFGSLTYRIEPDPLPGVLEYDVPPDGQGHQLTLRREKDEFGVDILVIIDNTTKKRVSEPLNGAKGVEIYGDDQPDALTVDFTSGFFTLPQGILFDGASGDNSLSVLGAGKVKSGIYTPDKTTRGSGTVVLNDPAGHPLIISFSSLSPLEMTGMDDLTFIAPNSADVLLVDAQHRISGSSGGVPFELLHFSDIQNLVIDAATHDGAGGSPGDSVTILPGGPGSLTNFTVNTGAGSFTIHNPSTIFSPVGGIQFTSGPNASLTLYDGGRIGLGPETYNTGPLPGAGNIVFSGGSIDTTIAFTRVGHITDTVAASDFTVNATDASNTMTLDDGAVLGDGLARLIVDNFPVIAFNAKTRLILNGGLTAADQADILQVNFHEVPTGLSALTVNGGAGNDAISLLAAPAGVTTTVNGGAGNDVIRVLAASAGVMTTIDGGAGNDLIIVKSDLMLPLTIYGGLGDDTIYGGAGTIQIDGGTGNNTLRAQGGNATIYSNGNDLIYTGDGQVTVHGGAGSETVYGGAGNDTIYGGQGFNVIHAGDGNTSVFGGPSGNVIYAGAGTDILHGGAGSDTIYGGPGTDQIFGEGGDDVLYAGSGRTSINGGPGNDTIFGGPAANLLDGGAGNNTIVAGIGPETLLAGDDDNYFLGGPRTVSMTVGVGNNILIGGSGTGGIIQAGAGSNIIVGPAGGGATITAQGSSRIWGRGGHNTISGGSGNDTIDAGPGGNNVVTGNGGTDILIGRSGSDVLNGNGSSFVYPNFDQPNPIPTYNPVPSGVPAPATLPTGVDYRGRWTEFANSASGAGLSGLPGFASEPSIAAGPDGQYVAWTDTCTGNFAIYVARHTAAGWEELAGSAHGSGISGTAGSARQPSITLDAAGNPVVVWTELTGTSSDIQAARFDPSANGGQGAWVALGTSLSLGGLSGDGAARTPAVVNTSSGPVVAYLDTSSGASNVYVKQFTGGAWTALGAGAASGLGVSGATGGVADLALATDGTRVAVAWFQAVAGVRQIYLREYSGGTWNEVAGSASGLGVSNSTADSRFPTLAYHDGVLFVAWQDNPTGSWEVYAARNDGATWRPAGPGATSGSGVSGSHGSATQPKLVAANGYLFLFWADDRIQNLSGSTTALYSKKWNGSAFVEQLPGDASVQGISDTGGDPQALAVAIDNAGHPFVAWSDNSVGGPQIYVRGNTFDVGTVYYVNDSIQGGDRVTTAPGNDGNSGLSPDRPRASVQAILNAYTLHPGDVIVVDSGIYTNGITVPAASTGFLILGVPGRTAVFVGGAVNLTQSTGVILQGLTLVAGVTVTGGTQVTLTDNTIAGAGVTLDGGTQTQVVHNNISGSSAGLTLKGGVSAATVEHNVITGGDQGVLVTGTGVTGLELRDNSISGTSGIQLAVAAAGHLSGNNVGGSATGLAINAAFTGLIENNDISSAGTGVVYNAAAALSGNRIHNSGTGVASTVAGPVNGLGFFGTTLPNQIYANSTGVQLTGAALQNQHVYGNFVGVAGSGTLVASDLDHANLIEKNGVGVDLAGPIEFNRISRNTIGIVAHSGQLIAHNILDPNTQTALSIRGQTDVRVFNNTFYSPVGDLIRIEGGSSDVEVRNNVLWAGGGYDLYVANDSQAGFISDYNDLYATGTGKLVFWEIDFTDLLDWQEDVHQFDLHSIGRTVVNPDWAQPRFFGAALDDFRVFDLGAGLRLSGPTTDAGDPLADQGVPALEPNLLTNPGFESGLTGWTANPSGSTQGANPAPWEGSNYFSGGTNADTTVVQTIDLPAAGFTAAQLDGQNLVAAFGGRVRSAAEMPPDTGAITLTFLDGTGQEISHVTVPAHNVADRWELVGGRLTLPAGTRKLTYTFEAVRKSGPTCNSFLDGAFVHVLSNIFAPDQGAYGNTAAETQQSTAPHIALRFPDLYTDWEKNLPHDIHWDTYNNASQALVRIDLYQDGPNGPQFLKTLSAGTPDVGSFTWIPASSGIDYGTHGLRIQVALVGNPLVFDRGTETFAVPENTDTFFVNDAAVSPGDLTSVSGSNRNTGKLSTLPKPYPNNVLRIYTVGAHQTLSVDAGDYPLLYPLVISNTSGVGDDEGFTFTGPANANTAAALRLANPLSHTPVVEVTGADLVTMTHLTMQGGQVGLLVHDNSTQFSGTFLTARNNVQDGVRIEGGTTGAVLGHIAAFLNGGNGITINGPLVRLGDSVAYSNVATGIAVTNAGSLPVENNEVYANGGYGILATNTVPGTTVIGNADLAAPRGNKVHDNFRSGVYASGNVLVAGNVITGQVNPNEAGIVLVGGEARNNVIHDNYNGISGVGLVTANRVYHNSKVGIVAGGYLVQDNVVYSNGVGLQSSGAASRFLNNLVYANTTLGIGVHSGSGTQVVNNTVFQPAGDALDIDGVSVNVQARNNILWTQTGYDVSVANDSQLGFASDFNDLYVSGAGKVGFWQSAARATFAAWQNADLTDQNSLSQDPLFVSPRGTDGVLGYANAASDGRDDDFHEQSQTGSFHGGSLAPVVSPVTGLPVLPAATLTTDASTSPAIDRGSNADSFANEPGTNGGYVNLGSYGNTAQASESPSVYVLVLRPSGGEVWPLGRVFSIGWRSHDMLGTVRIDLLQQGNATPVLTIADGVPNNGLYSWSIPTTLTPAGNYLVRVTRQDVSAASATSGMPFTLAPVVTGYFVNDGTVNAGDWTTAPGNDGNDGLSPATPKASIQAILNAYHPGAGDIIRVDAGTYNLSSNIFLPAAVSGVTILGFNDPGFPDRRALINRGNTGSGSYDFELTGATDVTLDHLAITGGLAGVAASNSGKRLTVSNSEIFGNLNYGIYLAGFSGSTVTGGTFTGNRIHDNGSVGIYAVAVAGVTASNNTIFSHSTYGIAFDTAGGTPDTVTGNTVSGNSYGISVAGVGSLVADNTSSGSTSYGYGLVIGTGVLALHNQVYGQTAVGSAGIQLLGEARENVVHDNYDGITGSGLSTANRVYHNSHGGIISSGTVQGNQVYANAFGIQANNGSQGSVRNNLVYANTTYGIDVHSARSLVMSNTVYQPAGDALLVDGASVNVQVKNNILWAVAGHDLVVAPDSEVGFQSDFNDLVVTGGNLLGRWENRDFSNRVDWFYELGFDPHSLTADPLFVNPAGPDGVLGYDSVTHTDRGTDDNFHVQTTSPTIDAGDPFSPYGNEPAPNGGRANQGADGNTAAATPSPIQFIQGLTPSGLEKFQAGQTVPVTWRTVGIVGPAGYYSDEVLADSPVAYYRLGESAGTTATDASAHGLNGTYVNGVALGQQGALPADTDTAAQFAGGAYFTAGNHVQLPAGFADFRGGFTFEAWAFPTSADSGQHFFDIGNGYFNDNIVLAREGTTNDLVFQVYSGSSAGTVVRAVNAIELNRWQYFAVTEDAAGNVTLYKNGMAIATGTTAVPRNVTRTTNYLGKSNFFTPFYAGLLDEAAVYNQALPAFRLLDHYNHAYLGTVNIDLLRDGDPHFVQSLADHIQNNGNFVWTIPTAQLLAGDYRIRIQANDGIMPQALTPEPFLVANNGHDYYVNDSSTAGDVFTTAAGNNANSGKSPDQPVASLPALLTAYTFGPGDVIHVDTGTYHLFRNVVLSAQDSGVRIEGPSSARAVFDRGNTNTGSYVFELVGVTDVTLDHLSMTGGTVAVQANDTSSKRLTVSNSDLYGNTSYAINLTGYSVTDAQISGNTVHENFGGISVGNGAGMVVTGNTVYRNTGNGIVLSPGSSIPGYTASGNTVYGNSTGIVATGAGTVVSGNTVYKNSRDGIVISGGLAVDNIVYDQDTGFEGILVAGGEARHNTVFDNYNGIVGSASLIRDNRVFHNLNAGIVANSTVTVDGNTVYANDQGIQGYDSSNSAARGPYFFHNLVYGNKTLGIGLHGGADAQVFNNTVYQPTGDALLVDGPSVNVQVKNNILWTLAGHDIIVAADNSETRFQSDYNDLYTSGSGVLGRWEGHDFTTRADWFYQLGLDQHSITADPRFVNPAGFDQILGFSEAAVGAAQILEDSSAGFSVTGTADYVNQATGSGGTFLESQDGGSASWTFPPVFLAPHTTQTYSFYAYWSPHRGLGSTSYALNGGFGLGTFDQQTGGTGFHFLGSVFESNDSNNPIEFDFSVQTASFHSIMADAVQMTSGGTVDDGAPGFKTSGTWLHEGSAGDYHRLAGGAGSAATWTFTNLTPGATYQLAGTWTGNSTLSAHDAFQVFDGANLVRYVPVSQQQDPVGFTDAGVKWQSLKFVKVTGTTLTVTLTSEDGGALFADAIRLQQIPGDHASDDDFHVQAASPTIDAGDPASYYLTEPGPNGGRINVGSYGNTPEATPSPAQLVQVVSPNGLEKFEAGQQVPIQWRSAGLTLNHPVALIDAGGGTVDNWLADRYQDLLYSSTRVITDPIDTSGVTGPAPQAVYQSSITPYYDRLSYSLPVPDGTYTLRLHFAETDSNTAGYRKFDIKLQGQTVQAGYDIVADAGSWHKATALSYTVTASGGNGIKVELVNVLRTAILSGIELTQTKPGGVEAPTAGLELSTDNGQTWTGLASGLAMDRFGRGTYLWTAGPETAGNTALIRVTADNGARPQAISNDPFLVANNGHDYYVNDASTAGDVFTTAVGDNANSGKSKDHPVASLRELLTAYTFQVGDVIHVDTGNYRLYRNLLLAPQDSGVIIQGPTGAEALLNRGNTSGGCDVIDLVGATNVTLDHLSISGGVNGIFASQAANSRHVTISNDDIKNNYAYGVFLDASNEDALLTGNQVHDNTARVFGNPAVAAIYVGSARSVIASNQVFGNASGIQATFSGGEADRIVIRDNVVRDNAGTGILGGGDFLVSGNTVFNQTTGISLSNNTFRAAGAATRNVVHDNQEGFLTDNSSGLTIEDNRVYHNSQDGLHVHGGVKVLGNQVYSNPVGILGDSSLVFTGVIANNVIYANTNQAILLKGVNGPQIDNNDLYQPVGDAVRLEGSSQKVKLHNNIVWVLGGYDLNVASDSQVGLVSDYNLFNKGPDPKAHVGFWNNATQDTLAAWQTASGQDTHALFADPGFVDINGADNVLGYTTANGGYDGGPDDNFYLARNSPAIDRGYSWPAQAADSLTVTRKDDPGSPNAGSPDYAETQLGSSQFAATGTAQHFFANQFGSSFALNLPFAFPFYDGSYTSVTVSSRGFLKFAGALDPTDGSNSDAKLFANRLIAPFWANLRTNGPGNDVFVDTSVANQVTVRWNATSVADGSAVNVAVTLFQDGHVRFDYGAGNANQAPTAGISFGNGQLYRLSSDDGRQNLANVSSVEFDLQPGITDIGAIEFRVSSLQTTPPTVTSSLPALIAAGGGTGDPIRQLQVSFSEEVNPIDALAPAVYELRKAGSNGFGSLDDIIYSLTPHYSTGATVVTLDIGGLAQLAGLQRGGLPAGTYRFTVFGTPNTSIHDLAGLQQDGDLNGTEGGSYVRSFVVLPVTADLVVSQTVDQPAPPYHSTVRYTVTVQALSGPVTLTGLQVADALPAGLSLVSAVPSAGTYDSRTGTWSIDALALGGSATLQLSATVNVSNQALTNTARLVRIDQGDTDPSNNSASASIAIPASADLAVSLAVDQDTPSENDTFHYTVSIDNKAGVNPASGVRVTVPLPAGVAFLSAAGTGSYDGQTGVWTVGSLTVGSTVRLQVAARVTGRAPQSVTATATVTAADQADPVSGNNSASAAITIADAALFIKGGNFTATEGVSFTNVVATFTDADPNGQPSDYSAIINWGDGNSPGVISPAPAGGYQVTGSHVFQDGFNLFVVIVTDSGGFATTAFGFVAVPATDPPVLTSPGDQNSNEGAAIDLPISALDADVFDATGLPAGLEIDQDTGVISGRIDPAAAGHYSVTVIAYDVNLSASITFDWNVVVATAPVLAGLTPDHGPVEGGSSVTLSGSNLAAPAQVLFGDTLGVITAETATQIVVTAPPHAAGTVSVTVTAGGLTSNALSFTFEGTMIDTLAITPSTTSLSENEPLTLDGSLTDPGTLDAHHVVIDWGDSTTTTLDLNAGVLVFSAVPHTYLDNPAAAPFQYQIKATMTDPEGPPTLAAAVVTVANVAPANLVLTPSAASILEGDTLTLAGAFTDPGTLDTHTVVINWGDGSTPDTLHLAASTRGFRASHPYPDNPAQQPRGSYPLHVTVTDKDGALVSNDTSVQVLDAAPVAVIAGIPVLLPEGQPITLTGSASDAGPLDQAAGFTFAWSVAKNGNPYTTGSGASIHFTPDDNGTYVVTLTARDKDGVTSDPVSATLAVTDVAPAPAISGAPASSLEGTVIRLTGSATDPSPIDCAVGFLYAWTVSKTQGTTTTAHYASGTGKAIAFTPDDEGTYVVSLTATDKDGATGTVVTPPFTVADAPLTGQATTAQARAGGPFTGVVASFTDANRLATAGDFTATIQWPLGVTTPGTVSANGHGGFDVTGSYTFDVARVQAVSVSIRDVGGKTATVRSSVTVTELPPSNLLGQAATIVFWHSVSGQTLIRSLNGGPTATALSAWLATTFPNLYGTSAGSRNLAGKTNAQVATFFQTLYSQPGLKLDAQVLATVLNVYATTLSLGGTAATAYGFQVSALGLGASSFTIEYSGPALALYNHTAYNIYRILTEANSRARKGLLWDGNAFLRGLAYDLFENINKAGGLPRVNGR